MKLFAVFRQGVGRHECGGIFSTEDLARAQADVLAAADIDSYHHYDVVPFTLDVAPELNTRVLWGEIPEAAPIYSARKS